MKDYMTYEKNMEESKIHDEINLFETDDDIDSMCLNCGFEQKIPDFIYGEMGILLKHKELNNKSVCTIYCNNCQKLKVIPKNSLFLINKMSR